MREPSSRDSVEPGDRLGDDGRYELLVRIGSGGMGAVYRARDHKLCCERAVKVLDGRFASIPAFVERFRREAMAASRIAHPNIVSVLDMAAEGERPVYLVMELLEGKTISQLLRGSGRMPWAQVQRYVDQIAAGLGAAHAHGVVHRDVKPGNCLILPDGQVKVLDFGIAKVTDMPAEVVALTAAGEIIGTCSYMAPEQIRGQVDKRSDIYALGVLTFRMLTGRVPFEHREQDKVLLAHLTEPPPTPSSLVQGLPPAVDELVLRMLAKQPHKRFESMEELRRALERIERGESIALDDPTALPPSRGPSPTAMFEDAPTQARMRDDAPQTGSSGAPVRHTINTAPAGSGALAQADDSLGAAASSTSDGAVKVGPGGTMALDGAAVVAASPGTMLLGEPSVPSSGGTLVAPGGPQPVGPMPVAVGSGAPPAARRLADLSAASSAPRVTRIAPPPGTDGSGVVRGVVAAIGGIALAAAVVVGVVMWQRGGASGEAAAPLEAPAAAPASAGDGAAEPAVDDAAAAEPPVLEERSAPDPVEPSRGEPANTPGSVAAADANGTADADPSRDDDEPPSTTPSVESSVEDAKPRKRRTPKGSGASKDPTKDPATTTSEPKPDPAPTTETKGKRKGDLRDPF